jgi:hypothetical protein
MPPREAIRGRPAHGRRQPDEHPATLLGDDPAGGTEFLDRLPSGHPGQVLVPHQHVAMVFRCHPKSEAVTSTDEASRIRWLTVDEITGHMDQACGPRH